MMIATMTAVGVWSKLRAREMGNKDSSADAGYGLDASAIAALEFLERSREVASERVVDGGRAQTSPSEREEAAAPGSGSPV